MTRTKNIEHFLNWAKSSAIVSQRKSLVERNKPLYFAKGICVNITCHDSQETVKAHWS